MTTLTFECYIKVGEKKIRIKNEQKHDGKNTKFGRVLAFFHDDLNVQRIDNDTERPMSLAEKQTNEYENVGHNKINGTAWHTEH